MNEEQQRFFEELNGLSKGEKAILRRESGVMLRDANGKAISTFFKCLPYSVASWQENRWFAVACLSCLWDTEGGEEKPLEQIIAKLIKNEKLSASTAHRVEILLDTKWDSDGYMLTKLSRLVKLIRHKSDRMRPDFVSLLDDLLYWNAENQSTQRKWARAIFSKYYDNEKE